MTKLSWDTTGQRRYETGVDHGVLYPKSTEVGVAWNGLVSVTESVDGGEVTPSHIDGRVHTLRHSPEDYKATLEAFTYPDELDECLGTQDLYDGFQITGQPKKRFDLSYRTKIGTDLNEDAGHTLHIVYNVLAAASDKSYASVSQSPEVTTLSYELQARPVTVLNQRASAHFKIDTTKIDSDILTQIEDIIYGTDTVDPRMLTIDEILAIFEGTFGVTPFTVTDNGDGSYDISGSDAAVAEGNDSTYVIVSDTAVDNYDGTYTVSSS